MDYISRRGITSRLPVALRYITSTLFFYLAFGKIILIRQAGMTPFILLIRRLGLPDPWSNYIFAALGIELLLAAGLWLKALFKPALWLALALCLGGIALSVASLIYRWQSGCGCGLLGRSETGFLVQKLLLAAVLTILYLQKSRFFPPATNDQV